VDEAKIVFAMIKYLLQSGQPPGTAHPYVYTVLNTTTKENLTCSTCWDLEALKASVK
jgi:ribose transport system substrate-binding protein